MSKKIKVAINGFGRIGRLSARLIGMEYAEQVEIVAVNDLVPAKSLAYLLKSDSTYGAYPLEIQTSEEDTILMDTIDGQQKIKIFSEKDPANLPWKDLGVDMVIESTGIFRTKELASKHLQAGAKKVIISAPAKDEETGTVLMGVNEDSFGEDIISNASCTTNCVAPALKVLLVNNNIEKAFGLTCHAYTASQKLQDSPSKKDLRVGRAAATNMIPTSTGAAIAVTKVLPELEGKLALSALRVPVITGSMVYLTLEMERETSVKEINQAFLEAATGEMQEVLEYSDEELVSSDIIGNPYSTIFDSKLTEVKGKMVKIVIWYDNEWGYTNRLVEGVIKSFR